MGAGSARRRSSVRWGIARKIIAAWFITLPITIALGGLCAHVIGLILGISYLLSALTQPVVGSFFSSHSIPRSKGIAVIYIPVAVFAFLIRFLPLPPLVVGVLMVFMITVQSMMQPSINALYQSMETDDERINFGLARGMGSVSYALSSFIAGQLLAVFAPSILPLMYMVAVVLLVILLMTESVNPLLLSDSDGIFSSSRTVL